MHQRTKKIAEMKTKLLVIFLLLLALRPEAQIIESIGIKSGMSFSNLDYKYASSQLNTMYDIKTGIYLVATAEAFTGKYLSVSTDLGFVQKGAQQEIELTTPDFPEGTGEFTLWKTTLGYLTFSPSLKATFSIRDACIYALAGPRIDYRIVYSTSPLDSDPDEEMHKLIFGLSWGAGFEYRPGRFGFLIELLGHPDFTPLLDLKPADNSLGLKVTGKSFILSTGVRYMIEAKGK